MTARNICTTSVGPSEPRFLITTRLDLRSARTAGARFERFSEGPLFGETYLEPFFTGTSCVLMENGIWKNWYLSCTGWTKVEGRAEPRYHIKYAESKDGINWDRQGIVAIDYKSDSEAGIVRSSVLKENDLYHMWYSYRGGVDYRTNLQDELSHRLRAVQRWDLLDSHGRLCRH